MIDRLCARRARSRTRAIGATLIVVALGLASRRYAHVLPDVMGKYPGDALWALMVFFGWSAVFRRAPPPTIAALALATCFAIETLKLWQSPWWSAIRQSTLGHLVFGHVFSWQNLVAYVVGVAIGTAIDVTSRDRPA